MSTEPKVLVVQIVDVIDKLIDTKIALQNQRFNPPHMLAPLEKQREECLKTIGDGLRQIKKGVK